MAEENPNETNRATLAIGTGASQPEQPGSGLREDSSPRRAPEQISAQQLLEAAPGKVDEVPLTPTQKAGMTLASWTGWIGAALILLILIHLIVELNAIPTNPLAGAQLKFPAATQPSDVAEIVAAYKSLNETIMDRGTRIFDMVITKTLFPIFTLLLGYIFGVREKPDKPR